jgi:peptide/nickel transport system permease protein
MLNYIARRLINMIVLLVAVSFIGFFIIQLPPGTILDVQLQKLRQMGGDVPRDQVKALELRYGVNDPFIVKYLKWVQRSAEGDFGTSYLTDQSVGERIWGRLSVSLG